MLLVLGNCVELESTTARSFNYVQTCDALMLRLRWLKWPAFGTFHYIQAIKAAIMTRFSDNSASTDISPFPVSEIIAPCQVQSQYSCGMWIIQPQEPTGVFGPVLTAWNTAPALTMEWERVLLWHTLRHGNGTSSIGKSSITEGVSIAMFEYQRVPSGYLTVCRGKIHHF